MHVWVVEVIAIYSPGLIEYLGPLSNGINFYFNCGKVKCSFSGLGFLANVANSPSAVGVVQHLFAIGRYGVAPHLHHLIVLLLFNIVLVKVSGFARVVLTFNVKNFALLGYAKT